MKQENMVRIQSEDKKIAIYAESDATLGSMHDFLLAVKGEIVERIAASQKQEKEAAEKVNEEKEEAKKKEEIIKAREVDVAVRADRTRPVAERPEEVKEEEVTAE